MPGIAEKIGEMQSKDEIWENNEKVYKYDTYDKDFNDWVVEQSVSGLVIVFHLEEPDESRDWFRQTKQETQSGNDSFRTVNQTTAINDKLLEYKCITWTNKKPFNQFLVVVKEFYLKGEFWNR